MIKILFTLCVVAVSSLVSLAQQEIVRKPLAGASDKLPTIKAWSDDDGYVLTDFHHNDYAHAFIFAHRTRGEIAKLQIGISVTDVIGFTSTTDEFTLYFKGSYPSQNRDYFLLVFFKNNNRAPVLTSWTDKNIRLDNQFNFSANNKLYVLQTGKDSITLLSWTSYDQVAKLQFEADKALLKELNKTTVFKTLDAGSSAIKTKDDRAKIYAYPDSVLLVVEKVNALSADRLTKLVAFDYTTQKITTRELTVADYMDVNSLIVKDRLFQVRANSTLFGLSVYEYPSLRLLKEYNYKPGDDITIKVGPLIDDKGDNIEENWRAERTDQRTFNRMRKGYPYLSGAILRSKKIILQIGTHIITSKGNYSPSGVYSGYSTETFNHFNTLLDTDGSIVEETVPAFVYDIVDRLNHGYKKEDKSDLSLVIENRSHVFSIHYHTKSKEYFIEEFAK